MLVLLLFSSCELFLQEPSGSIHAIYVALNYHGTDVNHLEGTLNDAKELNQSLANLSSRHHRPYTAYSYLQEGGNSSSEYDDPSTFGSLPTKENVLNQISALASVLSENDLTIFNYSGHGIKGGSFVLASPDALDSNIYDTNKKLKTDALLSVTELLAALSELPGKKLLILDSCYCGSFVQESGSSLSLIERGTFLDDAFDTYFSSEHYSPSLSVLAATTSNNTSREMPSTVAHIHGYFTAALLDGLGWDHDTNSLCERSPAMEKGELTTDSLFAYILDNTDYTINGKYILHYQHPTISGGAYALRLF